MSNHPDIPKYMIEMREARVRRAVQCLERFGCTYEQWSATPCYIKGAFNAQRANARHRGIQWHLIFGRWWSIWRESGVWDKRGTKGYVMCRDCDTGPYSANNVFIALASENISLRGQPRDAFSSVVWPLDTRSQLVSGEAA